MNKPTPTAPPTEADGVAATPGPVADTTVQWLDTAPSVLRVQVPPLIPSEALSDSEWSAFMALR